ncbi:MAG: hypothetical protein ACO265_08415 [Polynucleobacter sp.]
MNTLKDFLNTGVEPHEAPQFKQWLRMEVAKMVSEADVRHLVYTTFDQNLAASVKNSVLKHIFAEWEL